MASDLLSIAVSGARAARGALDVTAQNIANASSDGYTRRSLRLEEVSASGGVGRTGDISLSGAAFEADGPAPQLGEIVSVGNVRGEVVRALRTGFAIRYIHGPDAA